jgi:hypothetical protein
VRAGRDQLARQAASRRARRGARLVETCRQLSRVSGGGVDDNAAVPRCGWLALAAGRKRDREHQRRAARREQAKVQYFTQISSLAASEESRLTPGVAPMSSEVLVLGLYAALPRHTMRASPK